MTVLFSDADDIEDGCASKALNELISLASGPSEPCVPFTPLTGPLPISPPPSSVSSASSICDTPAMTMTPIGLYDRVQNSLKRVIGVFSSDSPLLKKKNEGALTQTTLVQVAKDSPVPSPKLDAHVGGKPFPTYKKLKGKSMLLFVCFGPCHDSRATRCIKARFHSFILFGLPSSRSFLKRNMTATHVIALRPTGWTWTGERGGEESDRLKGLSSTSSAPFKTEKDKKIKLEFACTKLKYHTVDALGTSVSRADRIFLYAVPYSEHSSYEELCQFMKAFHIEHIIPTVPSRHNLALLNEAASQRDAFKQEASE